MYPVEFPGAEWVGSKRDGKPWRGTTAPMVVLHTLEFNAFPQPWKWDSPSHIVYDPNTRECRQYLPMDVAAYAVRDNAQEDDELTLQVELFGRAAAVPHYDDNWYQGVAELCDTFVDEYGIPAVFADFDPPILSGAYAPQRMSDEAVTEFTGFLGHCHMGYGTDEHWDPGALDVVRVQRFMNQEDDVSYEDLRADEFDLWTDDNIMEAYDAGMFEDTNADGFYQYWVVERANRTAPEKARFMTDYYAHLWKRS